MKKLIRTVPKPKGDDFAVHEDIMMLDIPAIIENESHDPKNCVCIGCSKKKELEGKGLCKECWDKKNKGIQFNTINRV
jgi:hypothetical protein